MLVDIMKKHIMWYYWYDFLFYLCCTDWFNSASRHLLTDFRHKNLFQSWKCVCYL